MYIFVFLFLFHSNHGPPPTGKETQLVHSSIQ
jgi:hypothetical protein